MEETFYYINNKQTYIPKKGVNEFFNDSFPAGFTYNAAGWLDHPMLLDFLFTPKYNSFRKNDTFLRDERE